MAPDGPGSIQGNDNTETEKGNPTYLLTDRIGYNRGDWCSDSGPPHITHQFSPDLI